jgi:hypothetical protein
MSNALPGRSALVPSLALTVLATAPLAAVDAEQVLNGELLTEYLWRDNAFTGNKSIVDTDNNLWIRAKLGAKINFVDQVSANLSLVYEGSSGDDNDESTVNGDNPGFDDNLTINDAYIQFKRLGVDSIHLRLGRQPVSWNLVRERGAMLYDSRANRPLATSFDGGRLYFELDTMTFTGYGFMFSKDNRPNPYLKLDTPDNSGLIGINFDWEPEAAGRNDFFVTATLSTEFEAFVDQYDTGTDRVTRRAKQLNTFYGGIEWQYSDNLKFFVEGGYQQGDLRGNPSQADKLQSYAASGGLFWETRGAANARVGLFYDYLNGDNGQGSTFDGWVSNWEGTGDMLLAEDERYGELTEFMAGNLRAPKAMIEWSFLQRQFVLGTAYAWYTMNEKVGNAQHYGQELDLKFDWQYNFNTRLSLFGAIFEPGEGFRQVRLSQGVDADNDTMYMVGVTGHVLF